MNQVAPVIPQDTSAAPNTIPAAPLTPMMLIERAMSSGAGMDVIEKFMDMQERWEKNQNRKAFDKAIAAAKAEIAPIHRNATGHNNKRYADFAAIAVAVDPILSKYGLHYRFRTNQTDRISVTCILSHEAGHSEETTLSGPADQTGNKNAIQAIGSTQTYLQRYTLVSMLGLAASNDDDGKGAGSSDVINPDQLEELVALADEVGADKRAFCAYFKIDGFAMLPAKDFDRAKAALNKKRAR